MQPSASLDKAEYYTWRHHDNNCSDLLWGYTSCQQCTVSKGNHALCLFLSSNELCIIVIFLIADRNNLSLNSMKKRQRTKKFPMTAGSWTGPEGPTGKYFTSGSNYFVHTCTSITQLHAHVIKPSLTALALYLSVCKGVLSLSAAKHHRLLFPGLGFTSLLIFSWVTNLPTAVFNPIYNKILNSQWFSMRLGGYPIKTFFN